MNSQELRQFRLLNSGLASAPFESAAAVVSHLGAVQAQDFHPAKYALGVRMVAASDAAVEEAFDSGAILRTHMMRPTWHFVTPEDIRWIQALTSHRVQVANAHMLRRLELPEDVLSQCFGIIEKALRDQNFLTRAEMAGELEARGIAARGQRLAYIVAQAELECLICSGPRRGKQFTYALLEERAAPVDAVGRDEALGRLARIYFTGHGPAQLKDFSWWSGLTLRESREALELIRPELEEILVDGTSHWVTGNGLRPSQAAQYEPQAYLLSVYDEYFIGHADRSYVVAPEHGEQMVAVGNALLTSLIAIDGMIRGTWKRTIKKSTVEVELFPFDGLKAEEMAMLSSAVEAFGEFLEKEVVIR